jgi:hypothetical protein
MEGARSLPDGKPPVKLRRDKSPVEAVELEDIMLVVMSRVTCYQMFGWWMSGTGVARGRYIPLLSLPVRDVFQQHLCGLSVRKLHSLPISDPAQTSL